MKRSTLRRLYSTSVRLIGYGSVAVAIGGAVMAFLKTLAVITDETKVEYLCMWTGETK